MGCGNQELLSGSGGNTSGGVSGSGSGGKRADSVYILHGEQTRAPERENLKVTLAFLS